jgi:RNA polymerase sigma factor (sigma-70 family)
VGATLPELERLYRTRLAEFRRVATAIVGDPERGRDAVQEAFATAVRRRSTFRGEAPLEAWVWRIVVSRARDEARRQSPHPVVLVEAVSNGHAEGDAGLAIAIAALTERQRLVLFLRYYADLDYAAIAETLDISPGTVGATLHAVHAGLRRILEEVPT